MVLYLRRYVPSRKPGGPALSRQPEFLRRMSLLVGRSGQPAPHTRHCRGGPMTYLVLLVCQYLEKDKTSRVLALRQYSRQPHTPQRSGDCGVFRVQAAIMGFDANGKAFLIVNARGAGRPFAIHCSSCGTRCILLYTYFYSVYI